MPSHARMAICAECGKVFRPDRYNSWRERLYCGPSCALTGRKRSQRDWRLKKFETDPEWAAQARALSAVCQKARRAAIKASKTAAAEVEGMALRRREEADKARGAAEAATRQTALLLFGLCADLSDSKTPEEVARFSAMMVDKGVRLGGASALQARQSTYAFQPQVSAGP